jgi:hypothetical protein
VKIKVKIWFSKFAFTCSNLYRSNEDERAARIKASQALRHPERDPRALSAAEAAAAAAADPGGGAADRVLAGLERKLRELAADPVVGRVAVHMSGGGRFTCFNIIVGRFTCFNIIVGYSFITVPS